MTNGDAPDGLPSSPKPRGRRYVAFVIDGGTSQITRYTVDAHSTQEVRQKLSEMGLLVRGVQPRWLYLSTWIAAVAIGLASAIGLIIAIVSMVGQEL